MTRFFIKKWHWILLAAAACLAGLQLSNPPRTNPPVKSDFLAETKPPAGIATCLRAACYDCHSHETIWPWYSRVAPMAWLVAADVNEGREHFNFSEWPKADAGSAAKKLDRINEVLDYREMPPKKYTLIHTDARLTEAQRKQIMEWTDAEAQKLRSQMPAP